MGGGFLRLLLGLFILLNSAFAFGLEARVLIDETSFSKVLVGDMRLRCINDKHQTCAGKTYLLPSGQWLIERYYSKLKVTNLQTKAKSYLKGTHFRITGSFSLEEKNLQKLEIVFNGRKTDWVVHVPVDQYLYGVMSAEVPASWPLQALKAQAVASRTYFLFKKRERTKLHFDVRSDIMDQVFKMASKKHHNILKAVRQTTGMILVSQENHKVFPAYFHSDCGGATSSENAGWRKPTSLNQAVKDPVCKSAPKNNWSHSIDKAKLMARLHKAFYLPKGVKLVSILPRIHKKSRAHIVDFLFSNNILKRIRADDLRRLLGFGKLRSTQFEVSETWNKVVFKGRGFGHGVGMCQWGAQRWARKGKKYRSILKHYYPKAHLKKLDTRSLQAQLVF